MTKLNDRQTTILTNAATCADGRVLPLPETMQLKGGGLSALLRALDRRDLVGRLANDVWTITDAGRAAIAPAMTNDATRVALVPKENSGQEINSDDALPQMALFRPGTRQAQLLGLLRRSQGADIEEMVHLTGWQPHSIRAVLTGFRKRGVEVTRTKEGNGVSVYRATLSASEDGIIA